MVLQRGTERQKWSWIHHDIRSCRVFHVNKQFCNAHYLTCDLWYHRNLWAEGFQSNLPGLWSICTVLHGIQVRKKRGAPRKGATWSKQIAGEPTMKPNSGIGETIWIKRKKKLFGFDQTTVPPKGPEFVSTEKWRNCTEFWCNYAESTPQDFMTKLEGKVRLMRTKRYKLKRFVRHRFGCGFCWQGVNPLYNLTTFCRKICVLTHFGRGATHHMNADVILPDCLEESHLSSKQYASKMELWTLQSRVWFLPCKSHVFRIVWS